MPSILPISQHFQRSLDREIASEREFIIEVRANDRGVPSREGFANVTIKVMDMNDNAPFFEKVTSSES